MTPSRMTTFAQAARPLAINPTKKQTIRSEPHRHQSPRQTKTSLQPTQCLSLHFSLTALPCGVFHLCFCDSAIQECVRRLRRRANLKITIVLSLLPCRQGRGRLSGRMRGQSTRRNGNCNCLCFPSVFSVVNIAILGFVGCAV